MRAGVEKRNDTVRLQAGWKPPVSERVLDLAVVLLALAVYAPALRSAYLLDDYLQASMVRGAYPVARRAFDLYNFVDDASRAALLDRGMLPWWADPGLTIRFFRPLSSLLVWAEHTWLGDAPLALHLHSMLWWAASAHGARRLFQRLLPPRPALVAAFVFALAPCHALPLAWLANREALVSLAFGAPAIGAYLDLRAHGRPVDALRSLALFALAMAGGEYALCLGGFVVAFELVRARESTLGRGLHALPFLAPAVVYLGVRSSLGYGARGSGFYTDPLGDLSGFLATAPRRLAVLFVDAWCSLDHETLDADTSDATVLIAFVLVASALYVVLRRALARLSRDEARTTLALLAGSLLALGPVLAVVPSPRLLGAAMLGVAPVAAMVFEAFFLRVRPISEPDASHDGPAGTLALGLAFAQLVHGPCTSWLVGRHFAGTARAFAANAAILRDEIGDPSRAEVGVVRGMGGSFFAAFAVDPSRSPPPRWRILAQTGHVLTVRRDARTLEVVAPRDRAIFPTGSENLYRNEKTPLAVGQSLEVQGMRVTVLDLGPHGPRRIRYELDHDLDDERYTWVTEDRFGGFAEAVLPAEGSGKPFDP